MSQSNINETDPVLKQEMAAFQDKKLGDDEEEPEKPQEVQPFKFYLAPSVMHDIVAKDTMWPVFTAISLVPYIYHLIMTIWGVDQFADYKREWLCGGAVDGEAADALFSVPIALICIYHMIEWVKWTIFLTSTLVGVNLMIVFVFLDIVGVLYGIAATIIGFAAGFGAPADCLEEQGQPSRVLYLQIQILSFFLLFIFGSLPWSLFKIKGLEWTHEKYLLDPEDLED